MLAAAAALVVGGTAQAAIVTLGTAADFAFLTVPGDTDLNFGKGTINGDAGIGVLGNLNNMDPTKVNGTAYVSTAVTQVDLRDSGHVTGGVTVNPTKVSTAINDAMTAYNTARVEPFTQQIVGNVTSPKTITGTGGQNVIDITGSVVLGGADAITLSGTANDWFVLNIHGTLTLNGSGGIIATAPVTASHVLVNFIGTGTDLTSHVDNVVNGTILAPYREINFHSVSGAIYGGNSGTVTLQSGAVVNGQTYVPAPEPAALGLLALAGFSLIGRRHRRAA